MSHHQWPDKGVTLNAEGNLLANLAAWVVSVVEFSILLENSGGRPIPFSHHSLGANLFTAIVPVRDECINVRSIQEGKRDYG